VPAGQSLFFHPARVGLAAGSASDRTPADDDAVCTHVVLLVRAAADAEDAEVVGLRAGAPPPPAVCLPCVPLAPYKRTHRR
jgi:hypothetical protein